MHYDFQLDFTSLYLTNLIKMSNIPTVKVIAITEVPMPEANAVGQLNSGYDVPLIGYGTFGGHNGPKEVYDAVKVALEDGYKHIDTAYICK